MYLGQAVTYVDALGAASAASVVGIPDTGPSGFKILDLTTGTAVPYRDDAAPGSAYWLLGDQAHEERRVPTDEQPIALAVAEAAGTLPDADRRSDGEEHNEE